MNAAKLWPAGLAAILCVTVAVNGYLLWVANDRDAFAVEPDYYRKAVAWDSTLAERRRSAELGWTIDAALAPAASGARLEVALADRAGAALRAADVDVEAIHNREPERAVSVRLRSGEDGRAVADVPLRHAGLWELRFVVRRGADRYSATLRRDLGAGVRP